MFILLFHNNFSLFLESALTILHNSSIFTNTQCKAYEDIVTVQENMPSFLKLDLFSNKYTFQLSKFDYDSIIAKHRLNDKAHVKTFNWSQFNRSSSDLMVSLYSSLSQYYKSKLSSKLRHHICANFSSKMPYMEKRYFILRKKAFKGKHPPLKLTVQSFVTYAVSSFCFKLISNHSFLRIYSMLVWKSTTGIRYK